MKTFLATAVGTATLLATGAAYAAKAEGAEGGAWVPLLFTVLVFGLVMWGQSQLARERLEDHEE
jgi:hypothetical protein